MGIAKTLHELPFVSPKQNYVDALMLLMHFAADALMLLMN